MSDTKPFISTYDAVYSILESSGGDMTKNYDSVYSMVVELIRLIKGEEETVSSPQTYSLRKTMSLLADAGVEYPFDFTNAGYSQEESDEVNRVILSVYQADIDYSKTLYDAWNPSNTSASSLYSSDKKLVYAPNIDTSKVTSMGSMFKDCSSLTTIPLLDTSKVTSMGSMFKDCSSLTTIPQLNTSRVSTMYSMFEGCSSLVSIPQLNTSRVTIMNYMFYNNQNITSIPLLDTSNVIDIIGIFYNCGSLTDLGGFKNLKISATSTFLDRCPNLTVDSLMNVINNLYDLIANGLSGKTLSFGTTNLNKLTAEQIAIATNKGWTLT